MKRTLLFPFLLVLFLLPACQEQAETPSFDAEEAGRLYGEIDAQHDRIMTQYGQMASEMTPEMQQRYDEMQQMYGEAQPMYHQMMGGGMARGEMMDSEASEMHMDWDRLHAMDQRMRALHAEMAEDLRAQGADEMAGLHEQMTQYYDQALRFFEENRE